MMKMMTFISSVCVLFAILDSMRVEAGPFRFGRNQYNKIGHQIKKDDRFERCCTKINCSPPEICYPIIDPTVTFCECQLQLDF